MSIVKTPLESTSKSLEEPLENVGDAGSKYQTIEVDILKPSVSITNTALQVSSRAPKSNTDIQEGGVLSSTADIGVLPTRRTSRRFRADALTESVTAELEYAENVSTKLGGYNEQDGTNHDIPCNASDCSESSLGDIHDAPRAYLVTQTTTHAIGESEEGKDLSIYQAQYKSPRNPGAISDLMSVSNILCTGLPSSFPTFRSTSSSTRSATQDLPSLITDVESIPEDEIATPQSAATGLYDFSRASTHDLDTADDTPAGSRQSGTAPKRRHKSSDWYRKRGSAPIGVAANDEDFPLEPEG